MTAHTNTTCPCCGETDAIHLGKLPGTKWFAGKVVSRSASGSSLYRCNRCRLKFRYPIHAADTYNELYDNATVSTWSGKVGRPDWALIIEYVRSRLPNGGRILDFGCYTGGFLTRLGSRYERFGVEINESAAEIAVAAGLSRVWRDFGEIPGGARFDIILASDVIEHMPNPADSLDLMLSRLTENGALIITTGDADNSLWNRFGANWWYCFYAEHISFISKAWLEFYAKGRYIQITKCNKFYYFRRSPFRHAIELVAAYVYGWVPRLYLASVRIFTAILGRRSAPGAPGNGVSPDHLFIVIDLHGPKE